MLEKNIDQYRVEHQAEQECEAAKNAQPAKFVALKWRLHQKLVHSCRSVHCFISIFTLQIGMIQQNY